MPERLYMTTKVEQITADSSGVFTSTIENLTREEKEQLEALVSRFADERAEAKKECVEMVVNGSRYRFRPKDGRLEEWVMLADSWCEVYSPVGGEEYKAIWGASREAVLGHVHELTSKLSSVYRCEQVRTGRTELMTNDWQDILGLAWALAS